MGRVDDNATQHQPETIDDAPPLDEELCEPPADYQPQSAGTTYTRPPPPAPSPQAFPPPQDHPAVHSFPPPSPPQAFPPPQNFNKPPSPLPFPPPYEEAEPFPPPQKPPPHHFPASIPTGNQYVQPHHQQPNVASMPQFPAQHNQPFVGGIPVGASPSPLIINQPNQLPTQQWSSSLFDCMNNSENAIITLFFPCVTFGQIAEILDSGNTSCGRSGTLYSMIACCIAMPCLMSCGYRSKMRSKFGLMESPAPDWLVHCFCECCALCQEYRELQSRGFDPSIGWMGNVGREQQKLQQFGMTPPTPQRMM